MHLGDKNMNKTMKKKIKLPAFLPLPTIVLITMFLLSIFISGCNTIQGAGEDVQQAGQAVEDTAEDAAN